MRIFFLINPPTHTHTHTEDKSSGYIFSKEETFPQ